jgi:RNA recognition motif-containing protein
LKSKCFGFVNFCTKEEASRAIQALNGKKLGHKKLMVKYSCSKVYNSNSSKTINIIGFDKDTTEKELFDHFSAFGGVRTIPFYSVNYAQLTFASAKSATNASVFMNGQILRGREQRIKVEVHESTDCSFISFSQSLNFPFSSSEIDLDFFNNSDENNYDYLDNFADTTSELCLSEDDDSFDWNDLVEKNQRYSDFMFSMIAECL